MIQLILHLLGDYIFQNGWMANEKTKRWLPAITHGLVYSIPFLIIFGFKAWVPIVTTHILIDRFRLIKYVLRVKEWNFKNEWGYKTEGEGSMPPFMWVWLMIIADNTIHLTINYISIYFLGV